MTTPFRITGPGRYLQRDGGIAEVHHIVLNDTRYPWRGVGSMNHSMMWRDDGRIYYHMPSMDDLIAPAPAEGGQP